MKPELKKEALRRMRLLRLMNNGFDSPVGDFTYGAYDVYIKTLMEVFPEELQSFL